jgi:hypothetical protein
VVAPDDVWAVGSDRQSQGFVLRGDGKRFDRVPFQGGSLRAVFGSSPSDVWVAAYDGQLQHWDGAHWDSVPVVRDTHWLSLWGSSARDVWAAGLNGLVFHFQGDGWERINTPTREVLWSVSGSAHDDVWFVGGSGTRLHWNGRAFADKGR